MNRCYLLLTKHGGYGYGGWVKTVVQFRMPHKLSGLTSIEKFNSIIKNNFTFFNYSLLLGSCIKG